MINEGIRSGTTSPPTRELIAKWASYANDQIKEMHIRNAWRHEPFSWFPTSDSDDVILKKVPYTLDTQFPIHCKSAVLCFTSRRSLVVQ